MKINKSIVIDRPVEEVFAYVVDLNRAAEWTVGVIEARQTSDGPLGVGATYIYISKLAGQKVETAGEVTEFEPNRKYAWKATSGPFPIRGGFLFDAVEDGTRVTQYVEGEPGRCSNDPPASRSRSR